MASDKEMALSFLKDLISINTVNMPGNELEAALYVQKALAPYGFAIQVQELGDNRANLVARLGQGENKIIFNGHLDVVPAGEGWDTDPFQPVIRDGKLYGRGSCDMKAGLAAMMASAIHAAKHKLVKECELILLFSADEELGQTGTRAFFKTFQKGKKHAVVIGEPTQNQVHIAHRGVVRYKIELQGRQCHAGRPSEGVNAITLAARAILEMDRLHHQRQQEKHFILPSPTVACTIISGGTKDNVIPGTCVLSVDCRTIPGDTVEGLQKRISDTLKDLFSNEPAVKFAITPYIHVAPGIAEPESRVCKIAAQSYRQVFGKEAQFNEFPACCDMSCFTSNGLETVICGPGDISQAHVSNEYVELEQMEKAIDFYTAFLLEAQRQ